MYLNLYKQIGFRHLLLIHFLIEQLQQIKWHLHEITKIKTLNLFIGQIILLICLWMSKIGPFYRSLGKDFVEQCP